MRILSAAKAGITSPSFALATAVIRVGAGRPRFIGRPSLRMTSMRAPAIWAACLGSTLAADTTCPDATCPGAPTGLTAGGFIGLTPTGRIPDGRLGLVSKRFRAPLPMTIRWPLEEAGRREEEEGRADVAGREVFVLNCGVPPSSFLLAPSSLFSVRKIRVGLCGGFGRRRKSKRGRGGLPLFLLNWGFGLLLSLFM